MESEYKVPYNTQGARFIYLFILHNKSSLRDPTQNCPVKMTLFEPRKPSGRSETGSK